jgi:hypothetical protein
VQRRETPLHATYPRRAGISRFGLARHEPVVRSDLSRPSRRCPEAVRRGCGQSHLPSRADMLRSRGCGRKAGSLPNGERPKKSDTPMYITDLTHFLDKSDAIGAVKGPARAMAQFHVDVVAHASADTSEKGPAPRCFKCKKTAVEAVVAQDNAIAWVCPMCRIEGRISNWHGSLWDLKLPPADLGLTRTPDAMKLSSKLFMLSADDTLHALANTALMRMLRREDVARVPDFAGQRVREASIVVQVVDGAPLRMVHRTFCVLDFDADGLLDVERLNNQQIARLDDRFERSTSSRDAPGPIVDAARRFVARGGLWEPNGSAGSLNLLDPRGACWFKGYRSKEAGACRSTGACNA